MSEHFCLRCKAVVLLPLPSSPNIAFYECPACHRQYCLQPGKQLAFRWLHPITVALYGVFFESNPVAQAEAQAKLFVKQKTPAYLKKTVDEIRLELKDPTQKVGDMGHIASEEELRKFLRLFADKVEQLTAGKGSMSELQDFEIVGDHAEYRPTGELALDRATQLITAGIAFARARQVNKLLVVTLGLTGFHPPNVSQRYYFIHEWANAAGGSVRVAIVAPPEMIDPEKIGVTVATNIGFVSEVFTSEEEALTWLRLLK